jgi:predicted enzyme related to lactoylglutathione lyase
MVWFEIVGQHNDSLLTFYAEVLSWQADAQPPSRRNGATSTRRARFFRRTARLAGGLPWWVTFYTRVPDLESAIGKARTLGSRVLVPPTRHGDTTIAVISDPEGHPVGLCT